MPTPCGSTEDQQTGTRVLDLDVSREVSAGERSHHCTDCGWFVRWEVEQTIDDYNERVIRHHLETGHEIVRRSVDE